MEATVQGSGALAGRFAAVTGGSKGIGLGIAESFIDAGADVAIVARGRDELERSAEALRARRRGSQVTTIVADTADPDAIEAMFREIDAVGRPLDVFVANAGFGSVTPFLELTREQWDSVVALNLTGTFLCAQAAAQRMAAAGEGDPEGARRDRSILVVSSIRALGARPGRVPYSATKAGVNMMVRVAAQELAPLGIRMNILSPGITATPMARDGNPEIFAAMAATVPMGRAGEISDMGEAAVYLCSPAARFVTGANLIVDGGESLY